LQLLIFRQDAPAISPHPAQLAVEPYRASGLVPWRKAAVHAQQHLVVDKHELEMESVGD